jgi:hypothetical protein
VYWKEVCSEAWRRTKTGLGSGYRLLTSIVFPILGFILTSIILWKRKMIIPTAPIVGLGVGIGLYLLFWIGEWCRHMIAIPSERDAQRRDQIRAKDEEIARLTTPIKKPEIPMPEIRIQAGHLFRLFRQLVHHGFRHQPLWLSEIFVLPKNVFSDGLPLEGQINYPEALKELINGNRNHARIIETKEEVYEDFYGKQFNENVRFIIGSSVE